MAAGAFFMLNYFRPCGDIRDVSDEVVSASAAVAARWHGTPGLFRRAAELLATTDLEGWGVDAVLRVLTFAARYNNGACADLAASGPPLTAAARALVGCVSAGSATAADAVVEFLYETAERPAHFSHPEAALKQWAEAVAAAPGAVRALVQMVHVGALYGPAISCVGKLAKEWQLCADKWPQGLRAQALVTCISTLRWATELGPPIEVPWRADPEIMTDACRCMFAILHAPATERDPGILRIVAAAPDALDAATSVLSWQAWHCRLALSAAFDLLWSVAMQAEAAGADFSRAMVAPPAET